MKNKGEKKQKAARGRSMRERPTQSRKGVKGQLPLAESRGSASGGVWGNAPTVPRQTYSKEAANKGAGSEASLPVTSRVLRRAPKLLIRLTVLCRAKWRDQTACLSDVAGLFRKQGNSPLRRRGGGNENRRSLRLPPTPLRSAHPCFLVFIVAGAFASAEARRGQ
jgi:hypothetical protein